MRFDVIHARRSSGADWRHAHPFLRYPDRRGKRVVGSGHLSSHHAGEALELEDESGRNVDELEVSVCKPCRRWVRN
jgi:hypothetical protein